MHAFTNSTETQKNTSTPPHNKSSYGVSRKTEALASGVDIRWRVLAFALGDAIRWRVLALALGDAFRCRRI